jgi:hypothetical protein
MSQKGQTSHGDDWDFTSNMEALLALQGSTAGWRSWDDLSDAARTMVERARETSPQQLHGWLDENAVILIGQQLLVRSVHRQRDIAVEMTDALKRWLEEAGTTGTAAQAVSWLQREEPALMRAWMLSHLTELVERELRNVPSPGH